VYRSADAVDFGIQQFSSQPVTTTGFADVNGQRTFLDGRDTPARYATDLVVRRYGRAVLPVEIVITFADGHTRTERWDGRDRWRRYHYEEAGRATSAAIDPSRTITLDVNYTNNTWVLEPDAPRAGRKWSARWLVWLQDHLLTWASLV